MHETQRTFAYLLLASAWSNEIEAEVSPCSRGDVLELFMEREEQAEAADELWGFGWEVFMSRIAPVQLTYGWDPRPYLSAVFAEAGVEPRFAEGSGGDRDSILYFDRLPSALRSVVVPVGAVPNPRDKARFDAVLAATVELARAQGRGVLFIGDWGFMYDSDDYLEEVESVLVAAGMQFLTRHD